MSETVETTEITTCEQALAAWDAGELVWTVEMGGMGPGYEQAIQITAFEVLRYLLETKPDAERAIEDADYWQIVRASLDDALHESDICKTLGLSGAQAAAAQYIAWQFFAQGYRGGVDSAPDDRRIMATKNFPGGKP